VKLDLSVVRNAGFHVRDGDGGEWAFRLPSRARDKCRLLPAIKVINRLLITGSDDAMVPVTEVFSELAKPPYGIRGGLRPVILALYLATHHQRVALYEDGSYLPSVGGDEFYRLMKEPQAFHLQHCALEGVREDVFLKLLSILKYRPREPDAADLLDLVRPLAVFIAQGVPDYARRTNRLSAQAVAVRRVLLESREPVRMVFTQLPTACGLSPIGKNKGGDVLDPKELAAMAKGKLRKKTQSLEDALLGFMGTHQRHLLECELEHLDFLDLKIAKLDADISERMRPYDSIIELIDTVHGIGRRGAEEILAEIGPDVVSRFPDAHHLASWAKVCPGNNESAGKHRSGKTGQGNPWLRSVLVEVSWAAVRVKDCYFSGLYHRLAGRRGKKRAIVAVGQSFEEVGL